LITHLLCGSLQAPNFGYVPCRGLLLAEGSDLTLVDTGIGLADVRNPLERIGRELIDLAGFQFNERDTAVRQIELLGHDPAAVRQIVLTHGDPDHTGGLADFPEATIHIAAEELANMESKNPRYRAEHFAHGPKWQVHGPAADRWYGLEARKLPIGSAEAFLIPLFGHTRGHCGVAVRQADHWLLHVGDAYYLRVELERDDHPVSQLAAIRADDDAARRRNVNELRRLARDHAAEIKLCSYHDPTPPS
jgi:glyoxylase-like metal-dependent hydrolase (beta-lactamase superfamily II)